MREHKHSDYNTEKEMWKSRCREFSHLPFPQPTGPLLADSCVCPSRHGALAKASCLSHQGQDKATLCRPQRGTCVFSGCRCLCEKYDRHHLSTRPPCPSTKYNGTKVHPTAPPLILEAEIMTQRGIDSFAFL